MIFDLLKILFFIVLINWIIGMHLLNARAQNRFQKIAAITVALLLSVLLGIVVIL